MKESVPNVAQESCNRSRVSIEAFSGSHYPQGFAEWLLTGSVTQLVLAIIAKDSRVTMERWVFDIHLQNSASNAEGQDRFVTNYLSIHSHTVVQTVKSGERHPG